MASTSSTLSPSRSRTWSSAPHSGGGCAPAGGGGAYGRSTENICPMTPSGVQLTRPMRPPGRVTRTSSSAAARWNGANITPTHDVVTSNAPSA